MSFHLGSFVSFVFCLHALLSYFKSLEEFACFVDYRILLHGFRFSLVLSS